MIVACTPNGGIGYKGSIPWYMPVDLKHFARITTACAPGKRNAVIMGRKTWDSLPNKPLPKRQNIVISRTYTGNDLGEDKELWVCHDLNAALKMAWAAEDIDRTFVIGGSQLYLEALEHPQCSYVHLTEVSIDTECDTYFPVHALRSRFDLIYLNPFDNGETKYSFCLYKKKEPNHLL